MYMARRHALMALGHQPLQAHILELWNKCLFIDGFMCTKILKNTSNLF